MLTSLFRKSTPLNYAIIIVLVLAFFLIFHVVNLTGPVSAVRVMEIFTLGITAFASVFIVNFVVKKNGISKDNSYTILFFLLFMLFFPTVLNNINVLLANFFILLALRRMMSLHSLKSHKEKVFDASLWVFVAALFHFWSILFIALVFTSILFHVARDYRNWLLPFVALFAVLMTFLFFALMIDPSRIDYVITGMNTNYSLDYFADNNQNIAFAVYSAITLFFLVSFILTFSARPLILHSSYKKVMMAFVIGAIVYAMSDDKSNDLILFTMAPLAMMATGHFEITRSRFQKEFILSIVVLCALYNFFVQL